MNLNRNNCPFQVGDQVIYKPSRKGVDSDVMSSPSDKLVIGEVYKVLKIQDGCYVLVEGYNHPGGGIYWTEFELTRYYSWIYD